MLSISRFFKPPTLTSDSSISDSESSEADVNSGSLSADDDGVVFNDTDNELPYNTSISESVNSKADGDSDSLSADDDGVVFNDTDNQLPYNTSFSDSLISNQRRNSIAPPQQRAIVDQSEDSGLGLPRDPAPFFERTVSVIQIAPAPVMVSLPDSPRAAVAPASVSTAARVDVKPTALKINNLLEFITTAEMAKSVEFEGRTYTIIREQGSVRLEEAPKPLYKRIAHFFTDRILNLSLSAKDAQLSELLNPQQRHFRVDMDDTLVKRVKPDKTLPEIYKDPTKFKLVSIKRHNKMVDAYLNLKMYNFLKDQQIQGAKVSISSTGGWNPESTARVLNGIASDKSVSPLSLKIDEFDNKRTFNRSSFIHLGFLQKFRNLGNRDDTGRLNIMIDDKPLQYKAFRNGMDSLLFS